MPLDRQELAAAREKLAGLDRELVGVERELATTSVTLQRMERTGAGRGAQRELAGTLRELSTKREELLRGRLSATALIDRIRDGVRVPRTFEQAIGDLEGSVPVAMLPVRLETRFMNGNSELWVRVFPDTVHQHSFEPELTDAELAAATDYWTTRWTGTSDETRAVWEQMARAFRPPRARWLVDATTPTNLADIGTGEPKLPEVGLKAAPWTRPAVARQLPERWVVLGYRKGKEVARVWGQRIADDLQMGPTPDITAADDAAHPLHEPPDEQDTQAFDDGLRWMVDVDAALEAGMAVKLMDRDVGGGVASGFDLLVVVGVDWTLDPTEAADSLGAHLTSHGYTDGLAYPAVGTPTNVTDDAAPPSGVLGDPSLLDPAADRSPADDAAGPAFTAALGLGEVPLVSAAPGGEDRSDVAARHMNSALWAPTWGYFLEQLMRPHFSTGEVEQVRAHAVEHLRGRGPLTTVRIGRQPYGVLPIVASRPFRSSSAFENALAGLLGNLKRHWLDAADRVPNLVDAERPDEAMVTLLRMSPRSETFRFRQATGAAAASSFEGMGDVATFQELLAIWLLATVDVRTRPAIVDVTMADETRVVPVPLVAATPSSTDPLDPNYISTTLGRLRTVGGFRQIIGDPSKASTLLDALLRQSAQIELARASYLLAVEAAVADQLIRPDTVPNIEAVVMPREREVHLTVDDGITVEVESAPTPESVVLREGETLLELTGRAVAGVSGRTTMANHLVQLSELDLRRRFSTARFGDFRAALEHLAPLPSQVLDELAAETLDTTSHRLDAWFASLASRRLAASRKASPGGVHIGGYGWVERLRPAGAPVSTGYIHAPSVGHATTAAVLRSGHLARRSGDDAFAVDLSSRRVSLALSILDGVRQGQPIGALLGYRFERGLRDRDVTLAKYILDFRRVAPLATSTDGFDDGRPLEAVAARDVVDGATLAERAQSDANALLSQVGVTGADRSSVTAELEALVDALDAVSDLLVGESVHQAVMGNSERSGAALDALDRQTAPPDVSVVRTPRTGVGVGHRVVLALADAPADGAWAGLVDARSDAEPRLNTWAAAAIGDPGLVRIAASGRRTSPDGTTTDTPLSLTLADLGISAISTVLASVSGGNNRPSELHQRLADACFGLDPTADELHFDEAAPADSPASAIGLAELLEVCQEVYDLIASARPATTSDLLVPTERADDVADAAELARRADRAVAA
ncbi:MAG: hypothetical protein WBL35_17510, partial [Ornithinibacter sp.]